MEQECAFCHAFFADQEPVFGCLNCPDRIICADCADLIRFRYGLKETRQKKLLWCFECTRPQPCERKVQ